MAVHPTPDHAVQALRHWQTHAPVVSDFFHDAYAFLDWLAQVLPEGTPPVALRIARLKHARMAEYSPADGAMLPTITLDPTKSTDGWVAAEWLAHELIHHYQFSTKHATEADMMENRHDDEFQELAMDWGLSIIPQTGSHRGYVGNIWQDLLEKFNEQTGIDLAVHKLPGPQEPERRLHKWQCPECHFSFRSRQTSVSLECYGLEEEHEPVFMERVQ